ncbi:MAG: hypothetical protein AAF709_21630 [Pseudomonadota bacterium]
MPSDLYLGPDIPTDVDGTVVTRNGISIREIRGREGSDKSDGTGTASRTWLVKGSANPLTCRSALQSGVTISPYDGLYADTLSRERVGPAEWEFTATYSALTPQIGGYSVAIDTTGGQVLQTYAYNQTSFSATGETAPDFGNAIDVQDGRPQGVQRIIPALKINVRAKIATEYLGASPMAYAKTISSVTGTYNSAPMFDNQFAAGELLFAGATGEVISENPQLTFTFLASANVTGLTIGTILNISKLGHDYLWFKFKETKDSGTGLSVVSPRAAYVSRVYGPGNHGVLSIGVAPT